MDIAADILADALTYHAREEERLTRAANRWWVRWFGPIHVYGEAIYAHHAAQVHLRRLAKASEALSADADMWRSVRNMYSKIPLPGIRPVGGSSD